MRSLHIEVDPSRQVLLIAGGHGNGILVHNFDGKHIKLVVTNSILSDRLNVVNMYSIPPLFRSNWYSVFESTDGLYVHNDIKLHIM